MHIVPIAWMFVVVLMCIAEATSTQGTVLGAVVTFLLYGLLPLGIVMYLLGTPMRRRARLAAEQQDLAQAGTDTGPAPGDATGSSRAEGHGSGQAAGARLPPE